MLIKTLIAGIVATSALGVVLLDSEKTPAESQTKAVTKDNLPQRLQELEERVAALEWQRYAKPSSSNSIVQHSADGVSLGTVPLKSIVANLNEGNMTRYVRCAFVLKLKPNADAGTVRRIEQSSVQIKDWMIAFLSEQTIASVKGRDSIRRVCREVTENINRLLGEQAGSPVTETLLDEFNIQ